MATRKARKTTKKAPAKKAVAKSPGRVRSGVNKSAFIREQPPTMSAKEVVEAAEAQGIKLTEGFVYNVRSNAKAKSGLKGPGPARGAAAAGTAADELTFRQLVVALGTARARSLVDDVEARLAAVIAGR